MAYSRDFGRIFRNMDYWIELKRLLFKLFRITKFRTRSDKSIRSSILSKLKKELASHFARCGLTDRSVAIQILTLLMWQNFNTKRGTQQQKTVGMETLNTHFLPTVYILYKNTKFPSNILYMIFICIYHPSLWTFTCFGGAPCLIVYAPESHTLSNYRVRLVSGKKKKKNIVFTWQSHKVAYFYDVGSTYAIDQKINHLHNDRVANMWK